MNNIIKSKLLSIDVGILHLGLSFFQLNNDYTIDNIIDIALCDITNMRHNKVPRNECKLHHDNCISDYLDHIFQEYDWFDDAKHILIERQPITGLVAVEQIIVRQFRNKTILISPIKMHKYFTIDQYDYDNRKEHTIKIAAEFFEKGSSRLTEKFNTFIRQHDISDSICFAIYWCKSKNDEYKKLEKIDNTNNITKKMKWERDDNDNIVSLSENITLKSWMNQFIYKKKN